MKYTAPVLFLAALLANALPAQWSQTNGPNGGSVSCIAQMGGNIYAGTYSGNGVYVSTDNGTNWTRTTSGLPNADVRALAADLSGNLIAGFYGNGVYRSTDDGSSWVDINTALADSNVQTLGISGSSLFVGTNLSTWKRSLSEISSAEDPPAPIPQQFALSQNFPNPFNPTTTVSFVISHSSLVRLTIYDVLEREIATLLDERLEAGEYVRTWNAAEMPSGIYTYRLTAGTVTETRKMILLK